MPLAIKNLETEKLARAVAKRTGESLTQAIQKALEERLERLDKQNHDQVRVDQLRELLARIDKLPTLDHRSAEAILGYDAQGLPS